MKALEGTDIKNDLWKDKCKELYEISKELELENDGLRAGLNQLKTEKTDLLKINEQLVTIQKTQQQHAPPFSTSGKAHSVTEQTLPDSQLPSANSRNPTIAKPT